MYQAGTQTGKVRFSIQAPAGAQRVLLAGDFNGWKPAPMKKGKGGMYVADASVPAKSFQYKYVVDGQWITDPDHANWAMNTFGTANSIGRLQ